MVGLIWIGAMGLKKGGLPFTVCCCYDPGGCVCGHGTLFKSILQNMNLADWSKMLHEWDMFPTAMTDVEIWRWLKGWSRDRAIQNTF